MSLTVIDGMGCIIDCDYLINVKDCMELAFLPAPRRRLKDSDGSYLPIISVEVND